jgi:hypothetical protein
MRLNIVHLVDYINVMHVLKHLFDRNIYVIMISYGIHINIHFGKEYLFYFRKKKQHNSFFYRCELCRKGFLHQNQLYAHHKQRHSIENQTINEDKEYFTFDQNQ